MQQSLRRICEDVFSEVDLQLLSLHIYKLEMVLLMHTKQQSSIRRPNLILWLHHLTKGKIDAWVRDAQHLWDTVCPELLSAAFHDQNIARGKIAVPFIRVIVVFPQ